MPVAGLFTGEGTIGKLAKLWSVVFAFNVLGTIAFSYLVAMFAGAPITWMQWLTSFLNPATIGNTVGGVVFVAGLRGLQARSEVGGTS